jgi:glutamate carboxypeptidase
MRPKFPALLLAIFATPLAIPSVARGVQLTPIERRIAEYVDAHNAEGLGLLERLVNINSGSMNFDGVREVGRILGAEFDALGFRTSWVDGAPFERAGHLVATRDGTGPRLLLIGHLDTVFERDSPFQRFEYVSDSIARGPGIADMKGGDVIIVKALEALRAANVLDRMSITVVMTGDEELSGRPLDRARQALIDAATASNVALGFEDGDGNPSTALISRRGFTGWELRVHGRPAHSSQIFRADVGVGAIYETARILNAFYEGLAGEPYLTFNPGVVLAGTTVDYDAAQDRGTAFGKTNVVAEHAVVSGDLRTLSLGQRDSTKVRMQAIVRQGLPQTSAAITFRDTYPPLAPTDGNRRLLGLVDVVSRDLGYGPVTAVDPAAAGAADVSFTAGMVDMAIDGLGLGGADDHTVRETGNLRTLPTQTKRAAILMLRLTAGAAAK